jgi:hypothetical protein
MESVILSAVCAALEDSRRDMALCEQSAEFRKRGHLVVFDAKLLCGSAKFPCMGSFQQSLLHIDR